MRDHFLNLATKALDDSYVGERLVLCRKAAEALCKTIAQEPFPVKVGNNLSRMIESLFSRKLIDSNLKAHLEVIRIYGNLETHDNPSSGAALTGSKGALEALKQWYEKEYNPYPGYLREPEARESKAKESFPPEGFGFGDVPSISLNGSSPFSEDDFHGFLRKHDIRSHFMHRIRASKSRSFRQMIRVTHRREKNTFGRIWLVFGRKEWSENTLHAIKSQIDHKNSELLPDSRGREKDFGKTILEYGFESESEGCEVTRFKLRPSHLDAWNLVVLGQEACLDYLFNRQYDITPQDVFSHPHHSKHPAVKAFAEL